MDSRSRTPCRSWSQFSLQCSLGDTLVAFFSCTHAGFTDPQFYSKSSGNRNLEEVFSGIYLGTKCLEIHDCAILSCVYHEELDVRMRGWIFLLGSMVFAKTKQNKTQRWSENLPWRLDKGSGWTVSILSWGIKHHALCGLGSRMVPA